MFKIDTHTVILGAGFTGLVIADLLTRKGYDVILLEKESLPGGLSRTIDFDGFRFDLGGHCLYLNDKEYSEYIKYILGGSSDILIRHDRKSSIFFDGKLLRYPPSILGLFSYKKSDILGFLLGFFVNTAKNGPSLEEWLVSRVGKVIHNLYFRDYTKKVWGLPANLISADWAEQRIGKINKISLVKNLFKEMRNNKENSRTFYYTKNGIGKICDGLVDRLSGKASILFNAKINKIEHHQNKLKYLRFTQGEEEKHLYFKNIVSTIPLIPLLDYLPPCKKPSVLDLRNTIRYRDLVLVFMTFNKKSILNEHWVYFPQADVPFARLSEPKNWSPGMVEQDKTSLCVELFCNFNDSLWNKQDSELVDMVIDSLAQNSIVTKNELSNALVMRLPFAYPLLYLGYSDNLNKVTEFLSYFNNLYLAGRNGTHSYYDLKECVDSSKNTVNDLINNDH